MAAALTALAVALSPACSTTGASDGSPSRSDLDRMASQAMARLLEEHPEAGAFLEEALGWIVVDMRVAKIPVFGSGSGYAVVADRRLESHSYLRVSRFEVGGGLGAQQFKVVILVDDGALLEKAASGTWHYEASAQLGAGAQAGRSRTGHGYRAYWLTETGAAATVTVQVARAKRYEPDP